MTRFRTMYDISDSYPFVSFLWDTNYTDIVQNGSYVPLRKLKWMQDVVTPNWKKLMTNGVIINNPMIYCDQTVNKDLYVHHRKGKYSTNTLIDAYWRGEIPMPTGYPWTGLDPVSVVNLFNTPEFDSERQLAVTQSWADVQVSEIQALASLGELPETIQWISSLLGRAISVLRALKGKNLKNLVKYQFGSRKDSIDTVSDVWLELRYALRPMVFEMQQALTALQTQLKKGMRQTARGYHRVQPVSTTYETKTLGACYVDLRTTTVRRSNYRAGVLYTIDENINGLLAVWGVDQPLETIWELTPFSFIIDWFFDVGNVISSWSYNAGLHPLTSFITEHHEFICQVDVVGHEFRPPATNYVWYVQEFLNGGMSKQVVTIKRRIPNPSRSFLPNCKIKLDLAKITDLAFIGRQLINGFVDKKRRMLRL